MKRAGQSFFLSVIAVLLIAVSAHAQHKGIGFQAVLKKPDGTYPTASNVEVTLQVLDPITNCVLREEVHSAVTVTNGYLNLVLGSALATTPAGRNPSPLLSIAQVMDNSTTRTGLNCVDGNNVITSSGQTYVPSAAHARKLRLRSVIGADTIVADFNMRAIGFAVNSETLDGKAASNFVQSSAAITQSNVQSIFARYSVLDAILNGTYAGNAATATALASSPGACPAGQYMTAMTATGTITCSTPIGGGGTVTAVSSSNAYLSVASGTTTPVLTVNVGTSAGTVAAGNDARFSDARAPTGAAGGDLSGTYPNPSVAKIAGKSVVLTTPAAGEYLKYDGTNFVNATISTADATKLPLAGGTMSGAIDMGSQNLTNVGYVTMSSGKNLHLSNNASDPSGLTAADKGKVWFNSTTGEVKYWNGSAAVALGAAGSGLGNLNGQTGSSQTFAVGTSGTAPAWNSATDTHTLNIPMASTGAVTAGLISKTDYDAFNAKLGTSSSFAGDVTGTSGAMSVDKIKGKTVSPGAYASGQVLKYDGTNWVNAVLGFSDLGSKPTTLAGYGITDAQSSTLADGKILVGNASNVSTAVTISGDATLSNTGALTLGTVPISKGGTGLTSFAGDKVITTSAAGALQASSCGLNQVISFTAGGAITCANVSALSNSFVNDGNSFATTATLGTNDANPLVFETNNTARMTMLANGNIGVGTATPNYPLDVQTSSTATSGSSVAFSTYSLANPATNSTAKFSGGYLTAQKAGSANVNSLFGVETYIDNWSSTGGTVTKMVAGEFYSDAGRAATTSIGVEAFGAGYGTTPNLIGGRFRTDGFSGGARTSSIAVEAIASENAGTATDMYGIKTNVEFWGTAATNLYGAKIKLDTNATSVVTNFYGIYIDPTAATNATPTGRYGIYQAGANDSNYFAGKLGAGVSSPTSALDVNGAMTARGSAAPALSAAGQGRIYFDSTANKFRVSENGSAYADLVGAGGGGGGTGTVTSVAAGTGLNVGAGPGGSITSTGTLNIDVGTGANQIVQLTAASKYPAVDGSLITSLNPANLSAAVPITKGGTGQTTQTAGFDALSPNTTKGDITVHNGTNNIRLPAGTNNYVLQADSTQASGLKWAALPSAPGDATYAAKGLVQFNTDAATSGVSVASGVATVNTGTGANQIVKLDGTSKLPAVDGSALTNLNAGNIATGTLPIARGGTNSGTALTNGKVMVSSAGAIVEGVASNTAKSNNTFVMRDGSGNIVGALGTFDQLALNGSVSGSIQVAAPSTTANYTFTLPNSAGTNGYVLSTNGSGVTSWVAAGGSGTVTNITAGTGLNVGAGPGGSISSTGTLNIDVGTAANQIVQLTAAAKYPAVDGSLITNLAAGNLTGTVAIANGGTGQTTKTAAFDALSPNTTKGDITVHNGTNNVRLPAGANNYVLQADSTQTTGLKWAALPSTPGDASYAAKGLVQFDTDAATSGVSVTAGVATLNTGTTANKIVKLDGTAKLPAVDGSALTNLNAGNVSSGTLAVARGGTGSTSFSANTMVVANGTGSALISFTCASGEFLSFGAGGIATCATAPSGGGGGISSFNGATVATQTLATPGTTGIAPNWATNTTTGAHTLNIPMASTASVTAGLISKTDYDAFTAKLGTSSSFAGDVTGTSGATSVDKIKGKTVSPVAYAAGQVLRYDGTNWVNAVLGFSDLGSKPTTLAGYGITDAQSTSLIDGKILVGNGSNVATAVTMSGDATLSNAGALSLATVSVAKGGTGATSFTANKIVGTNLSGTALTSFSCTSGQVIKFDVSGNAVCGTDNGSTGNEFLNGGNSFTAAANLGTNDGFALNLKTNNTTKVTILTDGKVGVGTTSPSAGLDVRHQIRSVSSAGTVTSNAGTAIDWNNGNTQITTSSCGAFTFSNMLEGATYSLVVTGTTSGTCTFSQSSPDTLANAAFKFVPANTSTTAGTTAVYTFLRAGNIVYVSWITGF